MGASGQHACGHVITKEVAVEERFLGSFARNAATWGAHQDVLVADRPSDTPKIAKAEGDEDELHQEEKDATVVKRDLERPPFNMLENSAASQQ